MKTEDTIRIRVRTPGRENPSIAINEFVPFLPSECKRAFSSPLRRRGRILNPPLALDLLAIQADAQGLRTIFPRDFSDLS
jgi:hypothetical protein